MSNVVKGLLIALIGPALAVATGLLVNLLIGGALSYGWVALVTGILSLGYGIQAGIYTIYDLARPKGWLELVVDNTWSLINTIYGFLVGNAIFVWVGRISKQQSRNQGWIVYLPPPGKTSGFGVSLLQIHGTMNFGGAGQHERMHLLQARIFGPVFLAFFVVNYVFNFVLQLLWTFTIGGILWLTKVRETPYFRPSTSAVVQGFFGWIYYATMFEFWAYKSGNP
jgi:hypothetical protein